MVRDGVANLVNRCHLFPVVFGSLSSRRLLDEDVAQLEGLAGPDDEFPADLGAVRRRAVRSMMR